MDVARGLLALLRNYINFPTKLDLKNLTSKLWFLLVNESKTSIKLLEKEAIKEIIFEGKRC